MRRHAGANTVIAIDAPLIILNETGQRACETAVGKRSEIATPRVIRPTGLFTLTRRVLLLRPSLLPTVLSTPQDQR